MAEEHGPKRELPWYDQPDIPERLRELVALRNLGVHGLKDRSVSESSLRFSELDAAASALSINNGVGSIFKRIENLLKSAIELISDERYAAAALWTFELAVGSIGLNSHRRREYVVTKIAHTNMVTWRKNPRNEPRLIRWIDENIETLLRSSAITTMYAQENWEGISYLHRRGPYRHFRSAINAGQKIIALVGEPGTGKTTSARGFILDEVGNAGIIELNDGPEGISSSSISLELEKRGFEQRGAESPEKTLRRLIAEDDRKMVLIDDLRDWRHLKYLLPDKLVSVVVITSRQMLPTSNRATNVAIQRLTKGEAETFVNTLLPDATGSVVNRLTGVLCGRVGALQQVCAYIDKRSPAELEQIVTALEADRVTTLDRIAAALNGRGFLAAYHALLDPLLLSSGASHSLAMLEIATCLPHLEIRSEILEVWVYEQIPKGIFPDVRFVAYESAVAILQQYCLVSLNPCGLRMDEFTQYVLLEIFAERLEQRCNEALYAIDFLNGWLDLAIEGKTNEKFVQQEVRYPGLPGSELPTVPRLLPGLVTRYDRAKNSWNIYWIGRLLTKLLIARVI